MLLLALAIAPGIAISVFIYSLNTYGKESLKNLVISFILGMLATLPALLIQWLAGDIRQEPSAHSLIAYFYFAFIVVALSEEGCKFLVLRGYACTRSDFSEPFDGVVYAVMISMGFATVENIEYVRLFGWSTGVARFFLSVPAHAAFAVLMGYHAGLGKPFRGLLIAVLFHGSFDLFLFLQLNQKVTQYLSTSLLSFGAFATFYTAIRMALRAIRYHRSKPLEDDEFSNDENLSG